MILLRERCPILSTFDITRIADKTEILLRGLKLHNTLHVPLPHIFSHKQNHTSRSPGIEW